MNNFKKILIINDLTCMGKCSALINIPIFSILNIEVYLLPTALLSNHSYKFKSFFLKNLNKEMEIIVKHWQTSGIIFDAILISCIINPLSTFLLNLITKKFVHKNTLIFIDPVMGENGCLYKMYNIQHINFMQKLCYQANILTPNLTEACLLTNTKYINKKYYDKEYIYNIMHKLYVKYNNNTILLTGIQFKHNIISTVVYNKNKISLIDNKFVNIYFPGTGDIFCSVIFGLLLNNISIQNSCKISMKFVEKSILDTIKLNRNSKFGIYFEKNLNFLYKFIKNK